MEKIVTVSVSECYNDLNYTLGAMHCLKDVIQKLENSTDIENLDFFRSQLNEIKANYNLKIVRRKYANK